MTKSNRGGARPGAGRPPTDGPNKQKYHTKLDQRVVAYLRSLKRGTAAATIECAIFESAEYKAARKNRHSFQ